MHSEVSDLDDSCVSLPTKKTKWAPWHWPGENDQRVTVVASYIISLIAFCYLTL